MSDGPIHSTGRGGAANIGKDAVEYKDAGIHREGILGESADGEYSTGRGGAGNMVASPRVKPTRRGSQDVIPDENLVPEGHGDFHTGRGGGGNVHKEKYGGHTHGPDHESVIDKAKAKVEDLLHKKPRASREGTPTA